MTQQQTLFEADDVQEDSPLCFPNEWDEEKECWQKLPRISYQPPPDPKLQKRSEEAAIFRVVVVITKSLLHLRIPLWTKTT